MRSFKELTQHHLETIALVALSPTVGGIAHYTERWMNGAMDDLLFPIQHGMLWYPGMEVLPPFVIYQVDRLTPQQYEVVADDYQERLEHLFDESPIPYRSQNSGG